MDNPYYVLLTCGKNNAGDYLIKHRAKELLAKYRPDRELVDLDGYRPLTDEQLDIVNRAQVLILTGGPALHKNMYPGVYQLRPNLQDIKVPITSIGIGWHSAQGHWADTHDYDLSQSSLNLLERIDQDGLGMSVRDYHTQNVLFNKGLSSVVMTGCPALYAEETDITGPSSEIKKVAFSLGVALKNSPVMFNQMKEVLLQLVKSYGKDRVEVVFHHGLERSGKPVAGVTKRLNEAQNKYLTWLNDNDISYVDISGSAENLTNYYKGVDLHIGYRVHAHIYMSSVGKSSLLISEDGRGMGLERVIGGMILPGYVRVSENKMIERLHRVGLPVDSFLPVEGVAKDVINILKFELGKGVCLQQVEGNIKTHKEQMLRFIRELP